MNRLGSATSPYLRQHAANPVDWWPWSDAALAEARERDVPVLISVGHAACHCWHVNVAMLLTRMFAGCLVVRDCRLTCGSARPGPSAGNKASGRLWASPVAYAVARSSTTEMSGGAPKRTGGPQKSAPR